MICMLILASIFAFAMFNPPYIALYLMMLNNAPRDPWGSFLENQHVHIAIWILAFFALFGVQLLFCFVAQNRWKKCLPWFVYACDSLALLSIYLVDHFCFRGEQAAFLQYLLLCFVPVAVGLLSAWGLYGLICWRRKGARERRMKKQSAMHS